MGHGHILLKDIEHRKHVAWDSMEFSEEKNLQQNPPVLLLDGKTGGNGDSQPAATGLPLGTGTLSESGSGK